MRIAGFIENSLSNGRGIRTVVFTQGCPHKCIGCHNEHTWDITGGENLSISNVVEVIKNNKDIIDGVTISGGEPFIQPLDLKILVDEIRREMPSLNIAVYTGFMLEELNKRDNLVTMVLDSIDVLIDGKYNEDLKEGALRYTGSSNQRIFCKDDKNMWQGAIKWK